MPTIKKNFYESEEAVEAKKMLISMVQDDKFNTLASFSPNSELYQDNMRPFVDRHMDYMRAHPELNMQHYISNLRLMTRTR